MMLKTNQYQVPSLYHGHGHQGQTSRASREGAATTTHGLNTAQIHNSNISKSFLHDGHPNLFINTEHHPSLHHADSYESSGDYHTQHPQPPKVRESGLKYESDFEGESDEEIDYKNEEDENDYCYGGYHPVEINEILNTNYQILRKLGWGHFSTVWLAYDQRNDTHVAIKIVRSQTHYTQAALDEIKILEIINKKNPSHPGFNHLIKLYDWFYHSGPNGKHVCMVFEVLGENMLGLINKFSKESNPSDHEISIKLSNLEKTYGGLPLPIVKQISKQILLALDYLHRECGLIHTDIKPENILLEIKNVEQFVKLLKIDQFDKAKTSKSNSKSHSSKPPCFLSKHRKSSSSSSCNSPIKCSKPLPSPLTTSSNFDLHEYFSSYVKNQKKPSLTKSKTMPSNSSSSAGSIKCYDDHHDHSNQLDQSSSPATSSNLTSYVVCASETNSDDEDDEVNGDDASNYTYHESLQSRFSSVSMEDSPLHLEVTSEEDISSTITVKLADLGNACFSNLHFTNDIQTRQYRAPEILLGHKWGCSTDIWSTACLIFELITGDYLFDPKNGKNYNKDDDHLAQILELIEDKQVSLKFMHECKYALEYFHSDHKTLRRIKNLKYWDLKNVLIQKYKMDENLAKELDAFLTPMLKIDPKFRVDAGGWSNHTWLDEVKFCGFINRPCGCCGEDIKGWDKREHSQRMN